jgi:hypothetical protein
VRPNGGMNVRAVPSRGQARLVAHQRDCENVAVVRSA